MNSRYLYLLIFGIPSAIVAVIVAALVLAATAGAAWLFVLGDNPWPAIAEQALTATFVAVLAAVWLGLLSAAYALGRAQEARGGVDASHAWAAVGITVLLVLLIAAQQWGVGNLGAPSDSVRCGQFCLEKGYSASSMPPRNTGVATCSCLDGGGREVVSVPIADATPQSSR